MSTKAENVKQVISDTLGIEMNKLKTDADLKKEYGADSLEIVELVMELEKHFNISIPDAMIERLKTTQHFIDYIETAKPLYLDSPLVASAA